MTELMKQYEAETGEKAKKKVLVMYSTKRYGWGREKNHLFFTNKFVKWLMNLLDYLEVENSDANRRIATLESNVGMYKYEISALKAKVAELEKENERLRGIVHNLDHTLITNGEWSKV